MLATYYQPTTTSTITGTRILDPAPGVQHLYSCTCTQMYCTALGSYMYRTTVTLYRYYMYTVVDGSGSTVRVCE